MSIRIMWHSNAPWASTGYGNQTKLFCPRLIKAGYPTAVSAFYGLAGARLQVGENFWVYPGGRDGYGNDVVAAHAAHFKADIVITLIDVEVMNPRVFIQTNWFAWCPVDTDPISPIVADHLRAARWPVAYSRYGEEQMRQADLDPLYVPHGIDTSIYCPRNQDEARERVGLPQGVFVAGMVAANKGNPPRKCFGHVLEAWREFLKTHEDAVLYLHTNSHDHFSGLELPQLVQQLDFPPESVRFCDQYQNVLGFPETYMADVYASMDVLVNPSMGEGFGIPIVEAQACGTPVITGDYTSMPELTFAGWKVPGKRDYGMRRSWQYKPDTDAIKAALEEACKAKQDSKLRLALKRDAVLGAAQYNADRVVGQYWIPVLKQIEGELANSGKLETVTL